MPARSRWRRPWFELKVAAVWVFLGIERIGIAGDLESTPGGAQDNNFTAKSAEQLGVDISLKGLLEVCLEENDRRLAPYDARLPRPRFVPFMARLAVSVMKLFEKK